MEDKIKNLPNSDEVKQIIDEFNNQLELDKIEEMIKDNKIEFKHKDRLYRVRLLTMQEKEELDTMKRKKFSQLIQDKEILMEKDLIRIYKGRGIDIEGMERENKELQLEIISLRLRLGEMLAKNIDSKVCETLKGEIQTYLLKQQTVEINKSTLLEYSLENQLRNYIAKLITYFSLELKVENGWQRAYVTYADFCNELDNELINIAATHSLMLQYR